MSIADKVIAAVTPPESDEARTEARTKANAAASPGDWLSQILQHHLAIEGAFTAVKAADAPHSRTAAFQRLGVILTSHSIAEESLIYPALAKDGEKAHTAAGYQEQGHGQGPDGAPRKTRATEPRVHREAWTYRRRGAHHVYAEEGNWYLDLKEKTPATDQAFLTKRYAEEFERYVGTDALTSASETKSAPAFTNLR